MRRLACAVAVMVALMLVPAAAAWTWPTGGPVVRPFSLGPDAYAAGQHRGVDVQADVGEAVLAPAAGTISFAGTVPTHGFTVTIQTGLDTRCRSPIWERSPSPRATPWPKVR